jgi:hypothetical protein
VRFERGWMRRASRRRSASARQAALNSNRQTNTTQFPRPRFSVASIRVLQKLRDSPTGSSPKGRSKTYPYYHCRQCRAVRIRKAALEAQFLGLLEQIRPRSEFMALFREIVMHLWTRERSSSELVRARLETRVQELASREPSVSEAGQVANTASAPARMTPGLPPRCPSRRDKAS